MTKRVSFVLILLLLFAGCDWDNGESNETYDYEVTDSYTWLSDGFNQLTISTVNGTIHADADFGNDIIIKVTRHVSGKDEREVATRIDSITIDSSSVGGHLSLTTNMPLFDDYNYTADFEITAPPQLFIELITVNGAITANNFMSSGTMTTINGNIAASNHGGGIKSITTNGAINCDLLLLEAGEEAELVAVNGSISLGLPYNTSAEFNASTVIGKVDIIGMEGVNYSLYEDKQKSGIMGTGDAMINLTTAIGNITIKAND